ncbi:MAG: V-type ATP synthase subunit A [Eubacteriales bacterium]|nr:V-type ATP synthase subunit A [Eubacteriales bacterium]
MSRGTILKISGPLVVAEGMRDVQLFDVVQVSELGLIGEVIEVHGDRASVQVYEETAGLGPGEPVLSTGAPLSVDLAPGLMGNIFDGIQRPLEDMRAQMGSNIARGVHIDKLDRSKRWQFEPRVQVGDELVAGDIIGVVQETELIEHRVMVPPTVHGRHRVKSIVAAGEYTIVDKLLTLEAERLDLDDEGRLEDDRFDASVLASQTGDIEVCMLQRWPVRRARPHAGKMAPSEPLMTGQRVVDTFFPLTKGGTAAVPGPFGSGKTVIQHQLAKWAASDIVVYIGCGERGNEMTDVLGEFPELKDPKSGKSLMERTILIANTSDMPVAAREASIYTGITIAEYYRDMGYSVSIMADSTSRWAEALREMSGRLEEMPGEEGYPAYLGSRLAQFYERAGMVHCLGRDDRVGVLTAIGAVSPPGGDMSDPVVQSTLRIVKVFWSLDANLAYKRHFPAINWLTSYSLYEDKVLNWMDENVDSHWKSNRMAAMQLLQDESELEEIVKLVGADTLSLRDRLKLEASRSVREDFLHQNSFDDIDTYTSLKKQYYMLDLIMTFFRLGTQALERGVAFQALTQLKTMEDVGRYKYTLEDQIESRYEEVRRALADEIEALKEE